MDARLIDLHWLQAPPDDLRLQVRSLIPSNPQSPRLAQRLCGFRLTSSQLHTLGTATNKLAASNPDAYRLGVLSNGTTGLLLPALSVSALRHGVWLHVIGTVFDQVAIEALNPRSEINRTGCYYVLLSIDHRGLPLVPTPGDENRARESVERTLLYIDSLRRGLRGASDCTVIVQTTPQVSESIFGSLDRTVPGTQQWLIDHFNTEIRGRIRRSSDLLLDTAALAEMVGLERWHDPTQWTLGKFPFAQTLVPLYSEWVGRLIAAAHGKAHKCLVLDLDNTLWGGVIADDGLAGIVLGNGDPAGEAYLKVQRMALALRERGVLLAVSSKNEEHLARDCFRSHPEMLLKEEHIAVFQANWQDKASNLRAIAETLNIGIDTLVLLDDNPAERAQVREALPEVAVPELPSDPALYAETLLAAGYFEAVAFTAEDRNRADQYRTDLARTAVLGAETNPESFLRSLEMRAICGPFQSSAHARIAQLFNKTNQFNLTTRRYTESALGRFEQSPSGCTLQVRLIDRFGDNGLIAAVICIKKESDWIIDSWLMSCRVLNRRVEQATLNHLVSLAQATGVRALIGQYLKSDRNSMVVDHYARLGFKPVLVTEDRSEWRLEVDSYSPTPVPIEIVPMTPPNDRETLLA